MQYGCFSRVAILATIAAMLLASGAVVARAQAQNTDPSVAEAARKALAEKKKTEKPTKVVTNDDLDTKSFKPGQEGLNVGSPPTSQTEPPNPGEVAAVENADKAKGLVAGSKPAAEKTSPSPEIAKLKEQIALLEKELDLMRRELALDQDTFLSKPDHDHDPAGKAKLDAEQEQIADHLPAIEDLKAKLAELEKEAGVTKEESVPETPATPPATTPPQL